VGGVCVWGGGALGGMVGVLGGVLGFWWSGWGLGVFRVGAVVGEFFFFWVCFSSSLPG